jgi:hypothetical protein
MYINQSRCGQVQGIDILSGCKGEHAFFVFPSHLPGQF